MPSNKKETNKYIERDIPIIGSDYFLHIKRVGDKQTAFEKYMDFLREKGGYSVERKTTDGITGFYLCTLTKETLGENGKYTYPEVSNTLFVSSSTQFQTDKYGNFLLKSYFSGLHDSKRIKNEGKEIGSTIVISSLDKIREFTDDTVIYAEENGVYPIKLYDDKEKDYQFKFKYNFLNINGEQIRDEHFSPVGFDGTPILEEVNKPFYKVVDKKTLTDRNIAGELNIYPTSYVYRDQAGVTAYANAASLLMSNATTGYPAIADLTPYLQEVQSRKENADELYKCVSLAYENGLIDEKTQNIIFNILNQEMDMIDELEGMQKSEEMGD